MSQTVLMSKVMLFDFTVFNGAVKFGVYVYKSLEMP